jgi:hypothetical protein
MKLGLWLVVLTILKNVKVNGKDDIPYISWKKNMFETTKQTKKPAFYDLYRSAYLRTNEHPLDAP